MRSGLDVSACESGAREQDEEGGGEEEEEAGRKGGGGGGDLFEPRPISTPPVFTSILAHLPLGVLRVFFASRPDERS